MRLALLSARQRRFANFLLLILLLCLVVLPSGCEQDRELKLKTEPEGASVYLDNEFIGQTPIDVEVSASVQEMRLAFGDISVLGEAETAPDEIRKTLTAAYMPLTANLPLFVALENGYFEQNGIKVNAIEATSPNDILTGIAAGKVDFAAVLGYSLLFPGSHRYPDAFKLYSSSEETTDRYTASIIVKNDSPIKTYEDLRGKRIGVYTGLVQINFLKAFLVGMGIDESGVEIVKISPRLQLQGLVSDEYDALSSTEPTTTIAVLQGIARVVVESPRVRFIMCPFPSTAAAVSANLVREDPATVEAVVKSLEMAIDFINAHPEKAKTTLPKYTAIPSDIEEEVLSHLRLFKYCKLGEENRLNVQNFADYLYEAGIMKEPIEDVNRLFGDYEEVCPK